MKCRNSALNWLLVLTCHFLCHKPHHLWLLHLFPPPSLSPSRPLLPWEATVLFFFATLAIPPWSPRLAQFVSARHTARALGATCTGQRHVEFASAACVVVTPQSPGLVPADSAPCIVPAFNARFIAGVNLCAPRQTVPVVGPCVAHCSHPECSRGRKPPPHHPRPVGQFADT